MNAKTGIFIRWLKDLSSRDTKIAGAKAANIGELSKAGFQVPDGFVLTAQAFDAFLAANGLNEDSAAEVISGAVFPQEIAAAFFHGVSYSSAH